MFNTDMDPSFSVLVGNYDKRTCLEKGKTFDRVKILMIAIMVPGVVVLVLLGGIAVVCWGRYALFLFYFILSHSLSFEE